MMKKVKVASIGIVYSLLNMYVDSIMAKKKNRLNFVGKSDFHKRKWN